MARTLAAVATASGAAAVGIVRVSGPRAFACVRALWPALPTLPESHRARLTTLRSPDGEVLDRALVLPFVGPASFTGEDVVELHCHGGRVTLEGVLRAVLDAGAEAAEPGAFTRQALENGKLDLVQAEAIADVIHAEGRAAHAHAQGHLAGALSARIDACKSGLVETLTLLEAAIDFSLEEHVYSIESAEVIARLAPVAEDVAALLRTYGSGRLLREGVRVALVGRPNAGKSTLLNHLLGHDRAIVTDTPGTTRDYLEESVVLEGVLFRVADTAGLRSTDDAVEREGIVRSMARVQEADVVVALVDASRAALEPRVGELLAELGASEGASHRVVGVLFTKVDLLDEAGRASLASARVALDAPSAVLSVPSGEGAGELGGWLHALADAAGLSTGGESVVLTRARHREALVVAQEALGRALEASEACLGHELVAADVREALDALGGLTGAVTSEAILHRIFAGFCVGK